MSWLLENTQADDKSPVYAESQTQTIETGSSLQEKNIGTILNEPNTVLVFTGNQLASALDCNSVCTQTILTYHGCN